MTVHVISLDPDIDLPSIGYVPQEKLKRFREERILSIVRQAKRFGFEVRFWEGIIDERGGWAGVVLSYYRIVHYAKQNKLPNIFIAEDDMILSCGRSITYFLDNIPESYDIYSGGIYSGQVEEGRIVNGYSGNTLISVHSNFYDEFLNLCGEALDKSDHLDRRLGQYAFKNNYRICEPYVVYQLEGYSDNRRRPTQHSAYINNMRDKLLQD